MEPNAEKEDSFERRRLQNRMAQRRFRERISKKKAYEGAIYKLGDNLSWKPGICEASVATAAQPSLQQEPSSPSQLDTLSRLPAHVFSSDTNGDLDHDLFRDEDPLLHDIDVLGVEIDLERHAFAPTTTADTSRTDLSNDNNTQNNPISGVIPSSGSRHPIRVPATETIITTSMQCQNSAVESLPGAGQGPSCFFARPSSSTSSNKKNAEMCESWCGPLHMTARNGNSRITRLLVQHGSDCNEADSEGQTPLMLAVAGGYDDVVNTLLSHGARVTDVDSEQRTVLHLAVLHRRVNLLRTLLAECSGNTAIINGYDASGKTPLHMAIDVDFEAGVQTLLLAGADLTRKARRG